MIEGQGTKTYNLCKKMMYSNPEFLHKILRKVTDVVKFYMEKQIEAGADVVQIFDSWAAAIEPGLNMMNFLGNIWLKLQSI
jgi:uroporphyrinogen decarboxylase